MGASRLVWPVAVLVTVLGASCSSSKSTDTLPRSCPVTDSHVRLVAKDILFQQHCLGVAANKPFTIQFVNEDGGIPHNVVLYGPSAASSNGNKRFTGRVIIGYFTTTYHVPALPAGSYVFRCEIHPAQMFGRLTVGSPSG